MGVRMRDRRDPPKTQQSKPEPPKETPPPAELSEADNAYLADVRIEVEAASTVAELTAIYKMVEAKRPAILPNVKALCGERRKQIEGNVAT